SGAAPTNAVNGIATFTNIRLDKAAAGYALAAFGSGLVSATSAAFDITAAATTTTVTSDLSTATVVGQAYTVAVSVAAVAPGTGTPTGSVTVSDGTERCSAALILGTGNCLLTSTTAGTKSVTGTYLATTDFATSTSAPASHLVNTAATTTTITADTPDPSVVGQPVPITFAVSANAPGAGTPTGDVTVSDGSQSCVGTLSGGTGSCPIAFGSVGARTLTATYATDGNFAGSASAPPTAHQVNAAATTTTVTSNLSAATVVGEPYTVVVTVVAAAPGGGIPAGSVTVSDGAATCAATLAGGTGSCQLTSTTTGTKSVTGTYVATTDYLTSTSAPVLHPVNPAPTTTAVSASANPSVFGQGVTFTATVTPTVGTATPTGNVQFRVDGVNLGGAVALNGSGQATSTVATGLTVGTHMITADYAGSANFVQSTGTLSPDQTVNPASTATAVSSALNPSVFGQSVTFTATVTAVPPGSGIPTGNVQFKADGVNLGGVVALNGIGQATSPATTGLAAGTRVITAEFVGSTNFAASTGTLAGGQVVNPAATATGVTSAANPSLFGESVTFTATVTAVAPGSGIPTGTVQFKADGVDLGGPVALNGSGQATSPATSSLAVGTHVITAEYAGSANFVQSTGTLSPDQTVNSAPTATAVSSLVNPSVFGQSVMFTATVTAVAPGGGIPTGTVQFKADGVDLGGVVALNGSGQAQLSVDTLSVGTYGITAEYGGATNYAPSTGTLAGD
ncbi:MAG: Ig-like domain-containing protein, partial [Gemmatimonadota bacterium]|nr:Ig-like domain-containing protein [Gemmatimonadota bacterium]